MRRSVLSAILAVSLSLVACSDQPTEVPSRPEMAPSTPAPLVSGSCTLADVLTLSSSLFPPGPVRTAILALVNKLPPDLPQRHSLAARRAAIQIVDLLLKAFYAGKLYGGTSPETFNNVLRLIEALYCYVGATPPSLPGPTSGTGPGSDAVVAVLVPGVATTVCTPSGNGALFVSNTSVTTAMGPVTVAIYDLPDTPPPLRTSLDQYPRFYHYSGVTATGTVEFATAVTAAVSPRALIEGEVSLRLAHNVGPNFGDVEVLPAPAALPICPATTGAARGGGLGQFAWAKRLIFPTELHAASVALYELPPVGGTTKKFSEFGIVDITSNPGGLASVGPTEVTEEGGTVTRTVVVTSGNGTPIKDVPVTFTTEEGNGEVLTPQPVLTSADGKASASWALPPDPGTYTLEVAGLFEDNEPLGTTDPPSSNISSTPDVAFDPQSLTFSATIAPPLILTFGSGNGQTGPANQILTEPVQVFATNATGPVEGVVINFAVAEGSITATATTGEDGGVEVIWTLGPTIGSQTGTVTAEGADPLILSATATTPPAVRAVLEWGESPLDLDFHLTGPTATSDRFHVAWFNPGSLTSAPFASLDRDDRDSFGPETITISQVEAGGLYRFSVHDYSNRNLTFSTALTGSAAKVTVYLASGASQVFNVPPSETGGTLWTVFTLVDGTIDPVNAMSYESSTSSPLAFSIFGRTRAALQSDAAVIRDATARHPK